MGNTQKLGNLVNGLYVDSNNNVGLGTTNTSAEANLFLGAKSALEGGQIVLQKGTSQTYATHIDNYSDRFRIMSGTNTTSSTELFNISLSNGSVGVGTTLSSWGSNWRAIQMGSYGGYISGRTEDNSLWLGTNNYYDGTQWYPNTTGSASQLIFSQADIVFRNNSSVTSGTAMGWNERVRILAGGALCIGISSSIWTASNRGIIHLNGTSDAIYGITINGSNAGYVYHSGTDLNLTNNLNYSVIIGTNGIEQFRVRYDGLLKSQATYNYAYASTANLFVQSDGYFGRNTSSLKYKHSVEDYNRGLSDVLKLRAVLYESKNPSEAGLKFTGFIAEEIDAIGLTELVQYAPDGTPDALHYPHFTALLAKAIQELNNKITQLENK